MSNKKPLKRGMALQEGDNNEKYSYKKIIKQSSLNYYPSFKQTIIKKKV